MGKGPVYGRGLGSLPRWTPFLGGERDASPGFKGGVPGREVGGWRRGGGKKGGVTPCQQGEPPSGPWEKGTECVCSVLRGRRDLGSLDLHTGSSTGGLRKSGRGIRWKALEERETPGRGALIFSLPQPPPSWGVRGGRGVPAAPRIERLRLSWESSFLPGLLQPLLPPSPESARSSQRSPPPPLPSQCHRGCLALPPSPPLAPCFRPSLSCSLPPFASSSPFLPPRTGGILGAVVPRSGGWRRPRTRSDSTSRRALRPAPTPPGFARTHRHTHTPLSPSLFRSPRLLPVCGSVSPPLC